MPNWWIENIVEPVMWVGVWVVVVGFAVLLYKGIVGLFRVLGASDESWRDD